MIQKARVMSEDDDFRVSAAPKDMTAAELTRMELEEEDEDAEAEEAMRDAEKAVRSVAPTVAPAHDVDKELHSFEVEAAQVLPRTLSSNALVENFVHQARLQIHWRL